MESTEAGGFDKPGSAYPEKSNSFQQRLSRKRNHDKEVPLNVQQIYNLSIPDYEAAGGFVKDSLPTTSQSDFTRRDVAYPQKKPANCMECDQEIVYSELYHKFDYPVCTDCRINVNKPCYATVTRTIAKRDYYLKDEDLDARKPPLKFIARKNVHSARGHDMKLYLVAQLEQRAIKVHGSLEEMEEKKKLSVERSENTKLNRFENKIKKQKKNDAPFVKKPIFEAHVHEFVALPKAPGAKYLIKKCDCGLEIPVDDL